MKNRKKLAISVIGLLLVLCIAIPIGTFIYRTAGVADVTVLVSEKCVYDGKSDIYYFDYDKNGRKTEKVFVNRDRLSRADYNTYYSNGLLRSEESKIYYSTIYNWNYTLNVSYASSNPKYVYEYFDDGEISVEKTYYSGNLKEVKTISYTEYGKCEYTERYEYDGVYSSSVFYDKAGNITEERYSTYSVMYTYDSIGRLISEVHDYEYYSSTEMYEYYDQSDVLQKMVYQSIDSDGETSADYELYDSFGNLTEKGIMSCGIMQPETVFEYKYESETDRILKETATNYDSGTVKSWHCNNYVYDKSGNVIRHEDIYVTKEDTEITVKQSEYDERNGNLLSEEIVPRRTGYYSDEKTVYEYDTEKGYILNVYSYERYDPSEEFSLASSESYKYDESGNLIELTQYDVKRGEARTEYKYMNLQDYYRHKKLISDGSRIVIKNDLQKSWRSFVKEIKSWFEW